MFVHSENEPLALLSIPHHYIPVAEICKNKQELRGEWCILDISSQLSPSCLILYSEEYFFLLLFYCIILILNTSRGKILIIPSLADLVSICKFSVRTLLVPPLEWIPIQPNLPSYWQSCYYRNHSSLIRYVCCTPSTLSITFPW